MLSKNLYCYLFGTCKTAKAHNGIIMDDVPGAIIELGLHQYTNRADPFLSYSVAELQSIIQQFMRLLQYSELPPDELKKTREGWIQWASTIPNDAVQLPGRNESAKMLMDKFMNSLLNGVVANYTHFSKKQKESLGIYGLEKIKGVTTEYAEESEDKELTLDQLEETVDTTNKTLMEFYNIVLYLVALENIENINVAKVSLLSEKLGTYLSEPQELLDDINAGLELNEPGVSFYRFFIGLFLTLT